MTRQVFISYHHGDYDFASNLHRTLENAGFNAWIDDRDNLPGVKYRETIEQGLAGSFAVVVVVTPESKASEYVTYEWAYALGQRKHIIPVLRATQRHPILEQFVYVDFTRPKRDYTELIARLKELEAEVDGDLFSVIDRLYQLSTAPVSAAQMIVSLTRSGFIDAIQAEKLLAADRALNNT